MKKIVRGERESKKESCKVEKGKKGSIKNEKINKKSI